MLLTTFVEVVTRCLFTGHTRNELRRYETLLRVWHVCVVEFDPWGVLRPSRW